MKRKSSVTELNSTHHSKKRKLDVVDEEIHAFLPVTEMHLSELYRQAGCDMTFDKLSKQCKETTVHQVPAFKIKYAIKTAIGKLIEFAEQSQEEYFDCEDEKNG